LPSGFILQQDGAPAHTAKLAQDWIATNCGEFIGKDEWPPNSPDLNPSDYHVWGATVERYTSRGGSTFGPGDTHQMLAWPLPPKKIYFGYNSKNTHC